MEDGAAGVGAGLAEVAEASGVLAEVLRVGAEPAEGGSNWNRRLSIFDCRLKKRCGELLRYQSAVFDRQSLPIVDFRLPIDRKTKFENRK